MRRWYGDAQALAARIAAADGLLEIDMDAPLATALNSGRRVLRCVRR